MNKTIDNILSYVNEVVPNKIDSTSKLVFLSDLLLDADFHRYNTEETWWDTQTVEDQSEYDLPSGVKVKDLTYVGVSNSTYNSTDVVGSTTVYNRYKYYGIDDEAVGFRYTNYTTKLALIPKPDDDYHMRIRYKPNYGPYNASSDTTTIIYADAPLIEYIQCKLAAKICKSMPFPRTDLANNYEIDAESKLRLAKINYFEHQTKYSNENISYKRWW